MDGTTIAAIATPGGGARRGIVRLSGPHSAELVARLLRAAAPAFDPGLARQVVRGELDDGDGLQPVTLLWMRAPHSFTREDVAELHLPGSEPLLAAALRRVLALGARGARPGEFTRRAFLNGRLDLSRAEGVLALTEAASEGERAAAALLLEGGLDGRVAALREALLELVTLCEASLDFDEAETGDVPRAELLAHWRAAERTLAETRAWELGRVAPSALPRVLLVGATNAGKSSLWNALTGGRALVSAHAGTTRDLLEGRWELARQACLLLDGPGLESVRAGPGARAQELFARARRQADLVVWVVDGSQATSGPAPADARLVVLTKADLGPARVAGLPAGLPVQAVSARSGAGLAALGRAVEACFAGGEGAGAARLLFERHLRALAHAREALAEAGGLLSAGAPLDLCAEALRATLGALEELSGRTTPEDVLERIFARFCLGK